MSRWFLKACAAATLLFVPQSMAQLLSFKYLQRWIPPRPAFESRVLSCTNPQPLNRAALDDFVCTRNGPIVRVTWWGTLSSPTQGQRPFYLAFWSSATGACVPGQRIYQTCIVPDYMKFVGVDCQNRRVYRLSALLPATNPFVQQQGTHYWIQISEADAQSIRPQLEDFRWSAHRDIKNCSAVQTPPNWIQPLADACDGQPDDLAFGLQGRDVAGTITVAPGGFVPPILTLELRSADDGMVREIIAIEPDDDGRFTIAPDAPDGRYEAVLMGGGMLPAAQMVDLEEGTCASLTFFDVFVGDLNGDSAIGLTDLSMLLANFGRP